MLNEVWSSIDRKTILKRSIKSKCLSASEENEANIIIQRLRDGKNAVTEDPPVAHEIAVDICQNH